MGSLVYTVHAAPGHFFPRHPECPERVIAITNALHQLGVFQGCVPGQAVVLAELPQQLPEGLLAAVHSAAHVEALQAMSASISGSTAVRDPDDPDGPTFATPTSWADALIAACSAVALVDAVMASSSGGSSGAVGHSHGNCSSSGGGDTPSSSSSSSSQRASGFSICRPPGHHATEGDQMGFCLLNNAALAARHAQRAHGLKKVLILDWDVHHGNGTQDLFYSDPSVMLIDLHQEHVWPGSGAIDEMGAGEGAGATMNVPLPQHSGHAAAQRAFHALVEPAARRFRPDLILVSAGYDAHYQDPLEHLQFQTATYHWLAAATRRLAEELCDGRLLLLLEGGYNQQALGECVAETCLALLGKPSVCPLLEPVQLPHPEPAEAVEAVLKEVRRLHRL